MAAQGMDTIESIQKEIQTAIDRWKKENGTVDYWRSPLAAVASAHDPLFEKLKEVVDPEHAYPRDLLPEAESVIVFFIPFQRWVGEENDRERPYAARSWAEAYVTTNRLIKGVNDHLSDRLNELGHKAETTPATHNFDEEKLISLWSHKHIGYIAGLGTFGRHHLLITREGCCGRLGSLVTDMKLTPSERPQAEWCTDKSGGKCLQCFAKCRFGALGKAVFDRKRCYDQLLRNDAHYDDLPLVDVCGKCNCGVACSHGMPESK
ncbi:MAG: epoxyqueuosine reductase [Acidobacteriota bacterium]